VWEAPISATILERTHLKGPIEPSASSGAPPQSQIKSRERVRNLAEVYTHKREVDAMLDLVANMLPSAEDPQNTDRKFLEPACGSGNFLEEILRRKLAHVTVRRYGRGERYEQRTLRCVASIYGIDIKMDNVWEARARMRALINYHLDSDLNTQAVSPGFVSAVEVILSTNVIRADALAEAASIELVDYRPGPGGEFRRQWSYLDAEANGLDLFSVMVPCADEVPIHYSQLADHPDPVLQVNGLAPRGHAFVTGA